MPEAERDYFDANAIATKLDGEDDTLPPETPPETPPPEPEQEAAEPESSVAAEPSAPAAPAQTPPAPPTKHKIKVDGEEIEMTRADIARRIESLLAGDKVDFEKVASFTGYLNKKSKAISDERTRFEAEVGTRRQQIAEEFLQEYLSIVHGEKAPEILKAIGALLNPQTSATRDLQTHATPATIKPPEGVDENDPYWKAMQANLAEVSTLKAQLSTLTRQTEETTKAQKDARTASYVAQVRAEYEAASKAHPILQDDLYAEHAKSKVYSLVKDGGLDMAQAASLVAKELLERDEARITKYVEARKAAAKAATKKPDAAGPALSKPKPFSFKDDPDEIEARVAARLAENEE